MIPKSIFLVCTIMIFACGTVPKSDADLETNSAAEIEAKKEMAAQMLADGYLPGRIIYSDLADDCEYAIQFKDGEKDFYYVDPVNLPEEFRRDNVTVWVKYRNLRRMSRCEKADPVELTKIENRDE